MSDWYDGSKGGHRSGTRGRQVYDHNPGAHSNEEVGNDSGCRKRTHFGLMDSLRFASWMSQAFFMIVVNMSPRGMPSVHSISLSPPRP